MPPRRTSRTMPWFRWYVETTRDHKIRREPLSTRWAWVAVLTLCRKSPQPPRLLLSEGVPVSIEDIADEANISVRAAQVAVDLFTAKRMLDRDPEGVWSVTNWARRQPNSDNVAERVAEYRERVSNVTSSAESADGNVTETAPEGEREGEIETEVSQQTAEVSQALTADHQANVRERALAFAVPKPGQAAKAEQDAIADWLRAEFHGDSPPNKGERDKIDQAAALFWESRVGLVELPTLFETARRRWEPDGVEVTPVGVAKNVSLLRKPRPTRNGTLETKLGLTDRAVANLKAAGR